MDPTQTTTPNSTAILDDTQRQQLDGIVHQMTLNKEPDHAIQFVVDDFKRVHGTPPPALATTEAPVKPSLVPGANLPAPDLKKTSDLVSSIFPGGKVGASIGTLGGYLWEKAKGLFGGQDNSAQYNLSAPTPLQTVGDVAKGAALVGGLKAPIPATIPGAIAQGAGFGALGSGGEAATKTSDNAIPTGEDISKIGKALAVGAAVGGAVGGATSLLEHAIAATGDKIQMTAIKPSLADVKDGFSLDTVKKYDLGGSLSTVYNKTQAALEDLSTQLKEKLADSNATIDLTKVYDDTAAAVSGSKLKQFGSNTSVDRALAQLQEEVLTANPSGGLSIPDAQTVKQAAGKMGSWQYGVTDPESTARETVYNAFYGQLKKAIEENSPEGVRAINGEISKLIPVANAVIRRLPVAARNSALSLSDMVTASASILNPHALVGLGISLAQKEGSVGNLLSKLAPVVSKFAAPAGAAAGTLAEKVASPGGSGQ